MVQLIDRKTAARILDRTMRSLRVYETEGRLEAIKHGDNGKEIVLYDVSQILTLKEQLKK